MLLEFCRRGREETSQLLVTWDTNEFADSMVYYTATSTNPGTNPALYDGYTSVATFVETNHSVVVSGLTPETVYYFLVRSADPTGNSTYDDNSSAGYTATTFIPFKCFEYAFKSRAICRHNSGSKYPSTTNPKLPIFTIATKINKVYQNTKYCFTICLQYNSKGTGIKR